MNQVKAIIQFKPSPNMLYLFKDLPLEPVEVTLTLGREYTVLLLNQQEPSLQEKLKTTDIPVVIKTFFEGIHYNVIMVNQ